MWCISGRGVRGASINLLSHLYYARPWKSWRRKRGRQGEVEAWGGRFSAAGAGRGGFGCTASARGLAPLVAFEGRGRWKRLLPAEKGWRFSLWGKKMVGRSVGGGERLAEEAASQRRRRSNPGRVVGRKATPPPLTEIQELLHGKRGRREPAVEIHLLRDGVQRGDAP